MTDATTGGTASATLAGANPAATETTSGAAATTTASTTTGEQTWFSAAAPENIGFLEKKGWNTPKGIDDALSGYAKLEKEWRTGDKVVLPKDANDTEALNNLYTRLGRPESAEKYVFPKEVDESTAKAFAPEFHKLGFNQQQVDALAKLDLGRAAQYQQAQIQAAKADSDAAMNKLQAEWGNKAPEQTELAQRAMRSLGISVQDFEKAHMAMGAGGTEKLMRLLTLAGKTTREDNGLSLADETNLGFGMTSNRARMELNEKRADASFMARVMKGDKAAEAAMDRLYKVAYPGQAS